MNWKWRKGVDRQSRHTGICGFLGQISRTVILTVMVFACAAATMNVQPLEAASSTEALFQEALLKETGERDLEGALSIYKVVVKQAGDDRLLRAKAQLRIGICYERLGKVPEAIAAYEEVVMSAATTPADIAQIAEANLQRLRAQVLKSQQPGPEVIQGQKRTFAIGIQGVRLSKEVGDPTFRWWFKPRHALDGTVHHSGFGIGHIGGNIGLVQQLTRFQGSKKYELVTIGLREEVRYLSLDGGAHSVRLGIGPEVEFFFPSVPGLSVGLQAVVGISYRKDPEPIETQERFSVTRPSLNQLFTLRYYFF